MLTLILFYAKIENVVAHIKNNSNKKHRFICRYIECETPGDVVYCKKKSNFFLKKVLTKINVCVRILIVSETYKAH